MEIVAAALTIVILGLLYWCMIKKETTRRIGVFQALLPLALGIASMFISALVTVLLAKALGGMANIMVGDTSFGSSLLYSLFMAGGTEEGVKLLMILLALVILKSRVKNVYEYVLIGAAVGFGFAVAEEFFYGDFGAQATAADYVSLIGRMITVPAHMTFDMVMAEFLGRARFNRVTGKGSPVWGWVLAVLVPVGVHALYDACTVFNGKLKSGDMSGILIAFAGYAGLLVYELVVLIRFRKKTAKLCGMSTLADEAVLKQKPEA